MLQDHAGGRAAPSGADGAARARTGSGGSGAFAVDGGLLDNPSATDTGSAVADRATADASRALDRVVAALDASRRAEVDLLDGMAALHREVTSYLERRRDEGEPGVYRPGDAAAVVVDEFVAATGESQALAYGVVGLVTRAAEVAECGRSAILDGRASLSRVLEWHSSTAHLSSDDAVAIGEEVLTRGADGAPRSGPSFRAALGRRVRAADAADRTAAARRAEAISQRGSWATSRDDGTGSLTVVGEATRVSAASARLDAAARRAKAAGDPRTLSQLRSDLHLDLLLVGQLPGSCFGGAAVASAQGPDGAGSRSGGADGGGSRGQCSDGECADGQAPPVCAACGVVSSDWFPLPPVGEPVLPPARVTVVVGLDVLLDDPAGVNRGSPPTAGASPPGMRGAPLGWVPGFGYLDPEHVRAVAVREGSVWQRLVADPVSGHAVAVSPHTYRPTASVARFVRARDGMARDPGSGVGAASCEIDHVVPFDEGGQTVAENLQCLSTRGHTRKTKGQWDASMTPDGVVEWTSLTGRRYTTHPFDYRELG